MRQPTADDVTTALDVLAWAREQSDSVDVRASIAEAAQVVGALPVKPPAQTITFEPAAGGHKAAGRP